MDKKLSAVLIIGLVGFYVFAYTLTTSYYEDLIRQNKIRTKDNEEKLKLLENQISLVEKQRKSIETQLMKQVVKQADNPVASAQTGDIQNKIKNLEAQISQIDLTPAAPAPTVTKTVTQRVTSAS